MGFGWGKPAYSCVKQSRGQEWAIVNTWSLPPLFQRYNLLLNAVGGGITVIVRLVLVQSVVRGGLPSILGSEGLAVIIYCACA